MATRERNPRYESRGAWVGELLRKVATALILLFFFAVLLVMAALLWASPAYAASASQSNTRGKIQIRYSKEGASYDVYRIFDLVTQDDGQATAAEAAEGEPDVVVSPATVYDYVICEHEPYGDGATPNPWWTFLTTYGPDGANSATPYAVISTEESAKRRDAAYFIISDATVTVGSRDDYHTVVATRHYPIDASTSSISGDANQNHVSGDVQSEVVQDFAKAALAWAQKQSLTKWQGHYEAIGRATSGSEAEQADAGANVYQYSGDTAFVDDIPLGYYLLGTATGTFVLLTNADNSAFVYDKNERPELFLQVRAKGSAASRLPYNQLDEEQQHDLLWSEEHLVNWSYRTNVNLGDYVQFKTVIIAKQGVVDYHLHDVMETGLTFVDDAALDESTGLYDDAGLLHDGAYDYSPHVYLYNQATDKTYEIPRMAGEYTNWALHKVGDKKGAPTDGCDFEVEFKDVVTEAKAKDDAEEKMTFAYAAGDAGDADGAGSGDAVQTVDVTDWDRIVVTYWARVNEDAVVFGSDKSAEEVALSDDLSSVRDEAARKGSELRIQAHTDSDGNNRNTNSAVLSYGNTSHTTWARTEVDTYQFDIAKTAAVQDNTIQDAAYPLLGGATFSLYPTLAERVANASSYTTLVDARQKTFYYDPNAALRFVKSGNAYRFASERTDGYSESVAMLRSSAQSQVNVRGIEAGTYLLVEDEGPEGYQKLAHPIVVTVHSEAYLNTDMVENNNPGSRHTNDEGELTVTTTDDHGVAQTNVCAWQAESGGGVRVVNQLSADVAAANVAKAQATLGTVAVIVVVVAGIGFVLYRRLS